MKKILAISLIGIFASLPVFASDAGHPDREFITGAGFDLVKVNDVLVGTFNLIPIWADKKCGDHINGLYKKGTEVAEFSVGKLNEVLTGSFGEKRITYAGFDKERSIIKLQDGELTIGVHFASESFEGGHHKQITFTFLSSKGNTREIKLDGECCMGSAIYYAIFFYGIMTI